MSQVIEHSDEEIHALSSKFDAQVLEEASYILWYIHRSDTSSPYATLPASIAALTRDPALHEALRKASLSGEYDVIRNWRMCGTSSPTPAPVPLPSSSKVDAQLQSAVDTFLGELRPRLAQLVEGGFSLPLWSPPTDMTLDPATRVHLRNLHIPALKGKPSLLLHNLGRFKHDERLRRRLENIFMPNSHTFLVNTSGSGKTRLLLEGLCTHWGFYFTSLVDSSLLGSSDVQNAISTHVPGAAAFRAHLPPSSSPAYDGALRANREVAEKVFRRVLLARLLVFALFVEEMEEVKERKRSRYRKSWVWDEESDEDGMEEEEDDGEAVYQERWLLLQLQPSLLHSRIWDPFEHLATNVLARASDSYISSTTHLLLSKIRMSLSNASPPASAPSTCPSLSQTHSPSRHTPTPLPPPQPLFCILDEAQHAASQHLPAFRSSSPHGAHRPILRELVRAWEGATAAHGVFLLVSGTGISKDAVDQAMASAIMKEGRYRWCSDTGAFEEREVQAEWVEAYLPPGWGKGRKGRRLAERVWYWLHGRHRFTAGFVTELLVNGFRRPHGLLNAYIEHFTQFRVTDAQDLVRAEGEEPPLPLLSQYKLDFSKLKKNPDMLSTIHQLTTHYLMRAVLPHTLGSDEATYVQHGFARFLGADASAQSAVIDEPLVLLAAARWINVHHRTSYKHFAKQIAAHEPTSNGFENYLAFCVDMAFAKGRRKVGDVFTFCGAGGKGFGEMEAELVSLYLPEVASSYGVGEGVEYAPVRQFTFSGPSATLGTNAKTPEETLSWLAHGCHTPICFPHISLGPDLLFVLRLEDGTFLWVALQAKYSLGKNGSLSRPFLRRALRSVTPSCFFLDKDGNPYSPNTHPTLVAETTTHLTSLPHARTDAGRHSLLRVIASFPAQPNLKRCLDEDPDTEGHPLASLNMGLLKQLTHKLSPKDFLQGLEDPLQREAVKRKRGEETVRDKKTKKLKLN